MLKSILWAARWIVILYLGWFLAMMMLGMSAVLLTGLTGVLAPQ